jgi:hypothetical protein
LIIALLDNFITTKLSNAINAFPDVKSVKDCHRIALLVSQATFRMIKIEHALLNVLKANSMTLTHLYAAVLFVFIIVLL